MTDTGAVNCPVLRHTPQVRDSSFSFSTSAIEPTVPLVLVKSPYPLPGERAGCWPAGVSQEACRQASRSAQALLPACQFRCFVTPGPVTSGHLFMARILEKPELLAPAGDEESLRAAVAAGADAVYFGLRGGFNARARADNFAAADLPRIFDFLHGKGVQGFVTFNTLVFDRELPVAEEALADIARAGADAIIVQDLGVARLARQVCPELPLHASTQMTVSSAEAGEIARSLGVTRVVLPRELSIAEIARFAGNTDLELECFVHGALCVGWSGQCLTSEALQHRSANRGQCAQSCRLPYDLIVDGEHQRARRRTPASPGSGPEPQAEAWGRTPASPGSGPEPQAEALAAQLKYLLSPRDLGAWDLLPQLLAAGVSCFKIEGRMKGPEYVANVVDKYRRALDAAIEHRASPLGARDEEELRY